MMRLAPLDLSLQLAALVSLVAMPVVVQAQGTSAPGIAAEARGDSAQGDLWRDPSPHAVHLIAVAPDVRLEVLDWGGPAGRGTESSMSDPIVFLPGLGNTAHAFDVFAPRFRDAHRVYAVTPRGFGSSSHPDSGYDARTRTHDLLAALDSLGVDRAVLVGHSFAGEVMTRFAAEHPGRVRALIYVDAYSYGQRGDLRWSEDGPPMPRQATPSLPITADDSASPAAMTAYLSRASKVQAIEAEVRAVARFAPSGHLEEFMAPNAFATIFAQAARSEYRRVRAPALALYATSAGVREMFPEYDSFDAKNRRSAERYAAFDRRFQCSNIERFRSEMRCGVVREFRGENHFLHYSRADDVERLVREFLADRLDAPAPSCHISAG